MRAFGRTVAGALLLLVHSLAAPAVAKTFTVEGVTFSDELGGFTLVEVTGRGLLEDPFVVVEEVTGPGEIVLVIRGVTPSFGNRIGSQHMVGFAMTKVAINRTGRPWHEYELELREMPDAHSPYGDGLSFGQATVIGRPFLSSVFSQSAETDEPYDAVSFWDGVVKPGEAARFSIVVSDTSPVPEFYLFQQPLRAVAQLGEER